MDVADMCDKKLHALVEFCGSEENAKLLGLNRGVIDSIATDIAKFLLALTAVYSAPGINAISAHLNPKRDLEVLLDNAGKACEHQDS